MGEVKRRRPWEDDEEATADSIQGTFIWQLILCVFITVGVFIALNTKNGSEVRQFIHTELSRNIEIKDVSKAIDYVKNTANDYLR